MCNVNSNFPLKLSGRLSPPYRQQYRMLTKERAPDCTGPSGCLVLLAVDGTLITISEHERANLICLIPYVRGFPMFFRETSQLTALRRLKQVQRLIPSTAAMLSGTERVFKLKT